MPTVSQRELDGTGPGAVKELAVESSGGKGGASWPTLENAGERPVHTRNVGVIFLSKSESKQVSEGYRKRKAGRDTKPMSKRVSRQRNLEHVKSSADPDCTPGMRKCGYVAKGGDWEEFKSIFKVEMSDGMGF